MFGPVLLISALTIGVAATGKERVSTYHVSAQRGDDRGSGSAQRPWRTIARANRARPGATVVVAPGSYGDAPDAPGVAFVGATPRDRRERVIRRVVTLTGKGTRISGFTLAAGLDFEGGARDNRVEFCVVRDHWGIWGSPRAAPRRNRIVRTRMAVSEITAHPHGDDRDRRAPRIRAPEVVDCDIVVRRSGGVLWRWSGVDDARIVRTRIRLENGGSHNDDDASWKWLYVRRALIADSRIELDHSDRFGETGPFAPMWRDSTRGVRMLRTTVEAVRGNMIFSPNTAGTWPCSCGGNRFEDVVLKAPGTIWLYQCERPASDRWVRCRVQAGRFDAYNTGTMPSGLAVKRYVREAR